MDITKFVVSSRDKALLYGDYGTYRSQLSNRLLNCRKRLSIATKHRGKFHPAGEVTAEQIAENTEYLHLQLMTAERAWAHAMVMKSAHSADTKGITGNTRSHIVSRLEKAAKVAEHLADVLSQSGSNAGQTDVLEARAYAALLRGAAQFEKRSWEPCLRSYSVARVIYSALASSSRGDIYKDLLSETIDPSIRYAAYQMKTPRSLPIPMIARRAFPHSDSGLVDAINRLDPHALDQEDDDEKEGLSDTAGVSRTLTWRSREVRIEDAAIATAWASLDVAKARLAEKLASAPDMAPKDMAAAYDEVLIVSQDAVDATKQAIDDLRGEGVSPSDPRMQGLYITRTAVNYEMISWRIGRNRVLTGPHDGALLELGSLPRRKAKKMPEDAPIRKDPPGRLIAQLKEKAVLYDGTLRSLESVKELPGVAADVELTEELDATVKYFNALKSLAISRSYSIIGEPANALALIKYSHEQCLAALPKLSGSGAQPEPSLCDIHISEADGRFLATLLQGELQRCRALVEIQKLSRQPGAGAAKSDPRPLCETLGEYPARPVDLEHIVTYPPTVDVMPVKPIFLDLAWNYIEYPEKKTKAEGRAEGKAAGQAAQPEPAQQKRGWFGFGR